MQKIFLLLLILPLLQSCASSDSSSADPFSLYCEMVANDAKPIALSDPMSPHDLDLQWKNYETIAEHYGVQLYRESSFMVTSLWPSAFTEGKDVVIIYKYPRLKQYQQLKSDISKIRPLEGARRFGRLLGYSNQGINDLLMKNSDFRTLESFGVGQQITHLYYEDLEEAQYFYGSVLGLQKISDGVFRVSTGAVLQLHTFNKKHPKGQPKSTAIAFLTDQLPEWYRYLQEQQVPIKYTYKPKEGGPHDGFVAIDPGGYLLEFEEFKQHPENELFMAYLSTAERIDTRIADLNFFGSITWTYHNDLLKMQRFYEEQLGYEMVADQGWTKIYRTAESAFIGLVDERRGMMDYADEKAVELEWIIEDSRGLEYLEEKEMFIKDEEVISGPEHYHYRIRN